MDLPFGKQMPGLVASQRDSIVAATQVCSWHTVWTRLRRVRGGIAHDRGLCRSRVVACESTRHVSIQLGMQLTYPNPLQSTLLTCMRLNVLSGGHVGRGADVGRVIS